jgi:hypothetical protein
MCRLRGTQNTTGKKIHTDLKNITELMSTFMGDKKKKLQAVSAGRSITMIQIANTDNIKQGLKQIIVRIKCL